ncbi:hypothetical protein [Neobacillus sp. Marseille-QA0830]
MMPEENMPLFTAEFFNELVKEINKQYGFPETETEQSAEAKTDES